jgi:hypothetical protein
MGLITTNGICGTECDPFRVGWGLARFRGRRFACPRLLTSHACGVTPEQLSILSIEEKLAQLEEEFTRSAEYVLQKNADLYRRLS